MESAATSTGIAGPADSPEPLASGYRYPGSPPFADTDLDRLVFRGRAAEADTVLHSILSSDLLVLYAISGMGKTSLLNAGVLQELRDRDLWPVVLRLNDPDETPARLIEAQIREAAGSSDDLLLMQNPDAAEAASAETLWDLLSGIEVWRGNTLQHPVLVFDQFEELFTLGWSPEVRRQFILEFGEIIRGHRSSNAAMQASSETTVPPPSVKVVLVIREDSLGELESLAVDVPNIMRHRFRLLGLEPQQAEAAIRQPALVNDPRLQSRRFSYSEDAATTLLNFLRAKEERGERVLTPTVDPSQLQIICQHLERMILPTKKTAGDEDVVEITVDDLGGEEGLNEILRDFYRREIEAFPPDQRDLVRSLCETGLISRSLRRLSLEEGEIEANFGVSADLLEDLVGRRLLRADPRVGSVYYELAHDTLVAPILAYRDQLAADAAAAARQKETLRRAQRWDAVMFGAGIVVALMALTGVVITISADIFLSDISVATPVIALGVVVAAIGSYREDPKARSGRWRAAAGAVLAAVAIGVSLFNTTVLGENAQPRGFTADPPTAASALAAEPTSLEFGEVAVGNTVIDALVITNKDSEPARIREDLTLTGEPQNDWRVVRNNCGEVIEAESECAIEVAFAPSTVTANTGTLTMVFDSDEVAVALSGSGVAGRLVTSPAEALEFGEVQMTQVASLVVSNAGGSSARIVGGPVLSGPGFSVSNGCDGLTLGAGDECTLDVAFSPPGEGRSTGQLTFDYATVVGREIVGEPEQIVIALSGVGLVPVLGVEPGRLDFGDVRVSNTPTLEARVSNVGSGVLTFSSIELDAQGFEIASSSCVGELPPGEVCYVEVVFVPTSSGNFEGTLEIERITTDQESPDRVAVELFGVGITPLPVASPPSVDFGQAVEGAEPLEARVLLRNEGTSSLNIAELALSGDPGFAIESGCGDMLPPGEECLILVQFVFVGPGESLGSVIVLHDLGELSIPLRGVGVISIR